MEGFKRFLSSRKGVKVGTLYICTCYIVPSNLIVSKKNECSRTVVVVDQREQIIVVDLDIVLWHNRHGHMSEKGMKVLHSNQV